MYRMNCFSYIILCHSCVNMCAFHVFFYNNLTYLVSLKSISNGLKLGRLKIESLFESVHATESHSSPPFEANCLLNAVKIWKIADLNNKPAKHRTKLVRLKSGKRIQVTQTQIYIWILILTHSAYAGLIMSLNMHPISHLKSIYQKSVSKNNSYVTYLLQNRTKRLQKYKIWNTKALYK